MTYAFYAGVHRSGNQIREDFLRFFEGKVSAGGAAHRRVHSSSLVPANDPTLLFTNAGMNQFKDVFLGAEQRPYTRAVSSQKCVRAGGKHNDLENVGFTRRHHTFFEMLGNFSFGDYFKRDAIAYAWELLTSPQWFGIDPAKLYVTIFEGDAKVPRDDEAERFWVEVGVPKERIFGMSAKDNFWQMGDTGPCGPCSEIYYDLGLSASDEPGVDKAFPDDEQRYVEIWNLVFMQFDRSSDGTLTPLPKPSIDTGMGLERVAAVLQGVLSNFETDLFVPLIQRAAELTGLTPTSQARDTGHPALESSSLASKPAVAAPIECITSPNDPVAATLPSAPSIPESAVRGPASRDSPESTLPSKESPDDECRRRDNISAWGEAPGTVPSNGKRAEGPTHTPADDLVGNASLRIIADHARAATFLIADGVLPANEGRGYVLRKILRRGIRHGRLLGQEKPFLHDMVFAVRDEMAVAYPELKETAERVSKVVLAEEEQFARVLETGTKELDAIIAGATTISDVELAKVREETLSAQDNIHFQEFFQPGFPLDGRILNRYLAIRDLLHLSRLENTNGRFQQFIQALESRHTLSGHYAFRLYETFGMPLDFMVDAARDAGIAFDMEGFEHAKEEEQQRARASWKGGSQKSAAPVYRELPKTEFEGYSVLRLDGARVLALVKDGVGVPELQAGELGEVVLDATSFYADSGGQVGDTGWLYAADHNAIVAEVSGAIKPVQGVFAHKVRAQRPIAVGDTLDTVVDGENRRATERNHTGTHLLHAALREVLGRHVKQAGSLVDATRLRFDFSHFTGVAEEELREIESIVNAQVLGNARVETMVDVPIDTAVNEYGAMALFGEKYGDRVRVVKIGDFSTELCGGTHTRATGEIGLLKLVGESSVSSGVRRVEAISGTGALTEFRKDFEVAREAAQLPGIYDGDATSAQALRQKFAALVEDKRRLQRELDAMRMKSAAASVADSAGSAVEVKGVKVLAQRVDGLDKGQMRELIDGLRQKLGSGVVVLGAAAEGKVSLIVGVTKDLTGRVQAGKIVGLLAAKVGGKGGGRPDLAEAGGNDAGALDGALQSAAEIVGGLLG